MPKATTHRYSWRAAAWNMTTVAAAGIRISKTTRYPPANRPRTAGSKRPPRSAALAIHFMNFVSIVPLWSMSDPDKGSADLSCANRRCVPSGAPAPLFADSDPLAQSCNEQDDARDEEQRNRDCEKYVCRVQWVHLRLSVSETCALHVLTLGALCRARRSTAFVGMIETKPFLDMTRVRGHH